MKSSNNDSPYAMIATGVLLHYPSATLTLLPVHNVAKRFLCFISYEAHRHDYDKTSEAKED